MTSDATGPTPPEPTRPLSERERNALAELEAAARREDPEWSALLAERRSRAPSASGPRVRTGDLVLQVAVVALLAVLVLPTAWSSGLLVAIVMIGPLGVALWAMRRGLF